MPALVQSYTGSDAFEMMLKFCETGTWKNWRRSSWLHGVCGCVKIIWSLEIDCWICRICIVDQWPCFLTIKR